MFSITAFSPGILVLFFTQRNDVPNISLKDDRRSPHPRGGDFLEKNEEVSLEDEGSDPCCSSFEELVSLLACPFTVGGTSLPEEDDFSSTTGVGVSDAVADGPETGTS